MLILSQQNIISAPSAALSVWRKGEEKVGKFEFYFVQF